MLIPGRENYTEMTSEEFEQYTLDMLKEVKNGLEDVAFEHDVIIDAYDYAKAHGIALLVIADGKINYEIRSRQKMSDDMYPKGMPKFTTIWQEKSGENSIRSAVIDRTQYFRGFLLDGNQSI